MLANLLTSYTHIYIITYIIYNICNPPPEIIGANHHGGSFKVRDSLKNTLQTLLFKKRSLCTHTCCNVTLSYQGSLPYIQTHIVCVLRSHHPKRYLYGAPGEFHSPARPERRRVCVRARVKSTLGQLGPQTARARARAHYHIFRIPQT